MYIGIAKPELARTQALQARAMRISVCSDSTYIATVCNTYIATVCNPGRGTL